MAKIAFIDVSATFMYGGLQTWAWKVAHEFALEGHQVSVYGGHGEVRPKVLHPTIEVKTFPYTPRSSVPNLGSRFQRIAERLSFLRHARRDFIDGEYDWGVVTKPFDFFWPWLLPHTCQTKFAFRSGGTDFFTGDRKLAKKIDRWATCSNFNGWQIHHHYKHYCKVLLNGVDPSECRPLGDEVKTKVRASLGVTDSTILYGFAGRLEGWKGLSIALHALTQPELNRAPVRFLIIGNGPQKKELEEIVDKLDLKDKVIFLSAMPHHEIPKYYTAIDVGVFPSIGDEAFGTTIAEAMACGNPVVGSYVGGIPEIVGNEGHAGLLVPIGDVSALATAMLELAQNETLRHEMSQHARERVLAQFTWKKVAQRFADTLDLTEN